MSWPGQHRRAPAEAGRQGDLGIALADQRVADHVVPGAVEIAAAVEERCRCRSPRPSPRRRARAVSSISAVISGIGRDHVREDRDQLVTIAHHRAIRTSRSTRETNLPLEPEAIRMVFAHQHRLGQRVMGVARQDHVDAGNRPSSGPRRSRCGREGRRHSAPASRTSSTSAHPLVAKAEGLSSGNIQPGLAMGM
jgi:hypothetical protein